jgi:hypothetical protein
LARRYFVAAGNQFKGEILQAGAGGDASRSYAGERIGVFSNDSENQRCHRGARFAVVVEGPGGKFAVRRKGAGRAFVDVDLAEVDVGKGPLEQRAAERFSVQRG